MIRPTRTTAAFLCAPLAVIPAIFLYILLGVPLGAHWVDFSGFLGLITLLVMFAVPIAYIVLAILGIPLYFLFRACNILKPIYIVPTGMLVGAFLASLSAGPIMGATCGGAVAYTFWYIGLRQ